MSDIQAIASAYAHTASPHVVIACDKSYTIVSVNEAFCKVVSLTPKELLDASALNSSVKLLAMLEQTRHQLTLVFENVRLAKAPVKGICHVRSGEKSASEANSCFYEIFPITENGQVTHLVVQLVLPDRTSISVSPEIQDGAQLAPSQSLGMIIDSLSNVLFTLDVEAIGVYKFSFVNRAFHTTTGLPVEKVIGKYVHEIIPEPSLTLVLEKYKEAIERKQQVSWLEVSHYPAGQKTGEVSVVPMLDSEGSCFRLVGMVHDVTEHKEAEERQLRLTEDLYQHNRDLEQFTYIISHNLRAPLANALGLVRHLPDVAVGTEKYKQYLSYLTTSIENMDRVLRDLNQILSIRDKQNIVSVEPISVAEVCHQAGQVLEAELLEVGGRLEIAVDQNFRILASRAYLYSICYNLFSNAIKYRSKDRSLLISVTSDSTGENGPAIHYSDNGLGMDLDKAGKDIFKLYKRFHSTIEGRGIGLFLVKTHVEALGGHIKVQSKLNKGTTFSVFFKELV